MKNYDNMTSSIKITIFYLIIYNVNKSFFPQMSNILLIILNSLKTYNCWPNNYDSFQVLICISFFDLKNNEFCKFYRH